LSCGLFVMNKILAKKLKMTQIWKGDKVVPVTPLGLKTEADLPFLGEIKEGDYLNVSGKSKGRGFQGVVKRHGFHGGPMTHGQKNRQRAPGSIGATAPQRVIKGRRMPGHMGNVRITVRNLKIAAILNDEKKILVKGAVPGHTGAEVQIVKK